MSAKLHIFTPLSAKKTYFETVLYFLILKMKFRRVGKEWAKEKTLDKIKGQYLF
ncbi:hypothetical protein GCM10008917_07820 [Paraclostridium tenue]|uniref:Uncharacterized protein n=1 Tax=Paraclostridium tenue TaxID=1737 RepID=A0ABP3XBK4_9FIRM